MAAVQRGIPQGTLRLVELSSGKFADAVDASVEQPERHHPRAGEGEACCERHDDGNGTGERETADESRCSRATEER